MVPTSWHPASREAFCMRSGLGKIVHVIRVSIALLAATLVNLLRLYVCLTYSLAHCIMRASPVNVSKQRKSYSCRPATKAIILPTVKGHQVHAQSRYCKPAMMVLSHVDHAKDAINAETDALDIECNSIATQRSMADDLAAKILMSTHVGREAKS